MGPERKAGLVKVEEVQVTRAVAHGPWRSTHQTGGDPLFPLTGVHPSNEGRRKMDIPSPYGLSHGVLWVLNKVGERLRISQQADALGELVDDVQQAVQTLNSVRYSPATTTTGAVRLGARGGAGCGGRIPAAPGLARALVRAVGVRWGA